METLPLNPTQPYIDHIRAIGVEGRVTLWCHAYPNGTDWTVWIGETNRQQINANSFAKLIDKIQQVMTEQQVDHIALGM